MTIVGQTSAYVKLHSFKTPVRLEFLVFADEGDEALLSLDTLKDLTIVPWNFPAPMDPNKCEPRARRVRGYEEEEEWLDQREEDEEEGVKQRERKWKKGSCSLYRREWAASELTWR